MFFAAFDLLLINSSRYLVFGVYFSPHQKNIACEYNTSGEATLEIKINIFTCFDIGVEKTCFFPFFNVKLKILIIFIFSQFHKHIFRSNLRRCFSTWVLLKISQYSELKRDSNTCAFLLVL